MGIVLLLNMKFDEFQKLVERNDLLIRQCQQDILSLRNKASPIVNTTFKIEQLRDRIKMLTMEITDARKYLN